MIAQTSISYYGLNYVEHAEADFKEMKQHGQVSALTGEKLPYARFNTNSYRDYFRNFCTTLAREAKPDGFF